MQAMSEALQSMHTTMAAEKRTLQERMRVVEQNYTKRHAEQEAHHSLQLDALRTEATKTINNAYALIEKATATSEAKAQELADALAAKDVALQEKVKECEMLKEQMVCAQPESS